MVSIFAQTVYDETVTGFDPDYVLFENAFDNLVMPTASVSPPLNGFAYIENAIVEITFFGDLVLNTNANSQNYKVFLNTDFVFDGNLDLFSSVSTQTVIQDTIENNVTETDLSGSKTYTLDKYVDVPAQITPKISTTQTQAYISVDSATTPLDVEVTVSFVGRIP